jgi:hypothetical protein
VTARVTSRRLIRSIGLCLTVLPSSIACARSPRKQPAAELSQPPQRSSDAQAPSVVPSGKNAGHASPAGPAERHTPSCVDNLDAGLDSEAWYEAAAHACHPGSTRVTGIISLPLNAPGPLTVEIPAELQSSCWTAFASVDRMQLPIAVDIVDVDGSSQLLGTLVLPHSAIPALGPLCSVRTRFHHLAIRPSRVAESTLSLVFYSRREQSQ